MTRPKALDLFCCGGGAGMGLYNAGFDVVGIDIEMQKKYPFLFIQADVTKIDFSNFDFVWASPPCQAFTAAKHLQGNDHPELIEPIREMLKASGTPYCIENVVRAPLLDPILLCGAMFGLKTYRHRLFETSFPIVAPEHPEHSAKQCKMGRPPKDGEFIQVVGHFSGVEFAKEAMGIDWLGQNQLREAIPPAYSEYIGREFLSTWKGSL